MKREPTLADRILGSDIDIHMIAGKYHQSRLDSLRMAKRFVLDTAAVRYMAKMLLTSPRIVADAGDYAIPAFDRMWVEFPARPFFEALGYATDDTSDTQIGYLYHGPLVNSFAATDEGIPLMSPVEYLLHHPMTMEQELAIAESLGTSRVGLDFWFWGDSARAFTGGRREVNTEIDTWDTEGMRVLRDSHTARLCPFHPDFLEARRKHNEKPPILSSLIQGSGGDLRNAVALLLFLNRTADIQYQVDVPMGRGIFRRRVRPLLPYRTVTLKLDPGPRLVKLSAGLGIKRRLHDVRGHFCHDQVARAGCPHGQEYQGDWGEWWVETDVLSWTCQRCHGKRWWRKEHKRGDSKLGEVGHEYQVTR